MRGMARPMLCRSTALEGREGCPMNRLTVTQPGAPREDPIACWVIDSVSIDRSHTHLAA